MYVLELKILHRQSKLFTNLGGHQNPLWIKAKYNVRGSLCQLLKVEKFGI